MSSKSYSHFFSKNTCELDIVLTRTVNILTTNELVKLSTLCTTGPRLFGFVSALTEVICFEVFVFLRFKSN